MNALNLELCSQRKITKYCRNALGLACGFEVTDSDANIIYYFIQGYISALLDEGIINQEEHNVILYETLERNGEIPFKGCNKCNCSGQIPDPEFFNTWQPGDENFNCGITQVICPECQGRGRL